jgi:hypothetical protein
MVWWVNLLLYGWDQQPAVKAYTNRKFIEKLQLKADYRKSKCNKI